MTRCVERKEAQRRGDLFYFTGIPCKRGHVCYRYVSVFKCVECASLEMAAKRDATQIRRAARPLSIRQQAIADGHTRYNTGKACPRGHFSDRETVNSACLECSREDRLRRDSESDKDRNRRNRYRKEQAERYRSHVRNRRAKLRGSHTAEDIDAIWNEQRGRCAYCKCKLTAGHQVDHIRPLSKGGSNTRINLQLTCQTCNARKGAKDPIDFARQLGKLI